MFCQQKNQHPDGGAWIWHVPQDTASKGSEVSGIVTGSHALWQVVMTPSKAVVEVGGGKGHGYFEWGGGREGGRKGRRRHDQQHLSAVIYNLPSVSLSFSFALLESVPAK